MNLNIKKKVKPLLKSLKVSEESKAILDTYCSENKLKIKDVVEALIEKLKDVKN